MEYAAVLYFLRNGVKLHFYSLGTIFEENMKGVQRGAAPWLWVSNRGEQHPCWHTIFRLESLVCYTFVEQMAAGIVAHPEKCGHSCGVLAGKVAPCGAA